MTLPTKSQVEARARKVLAEMGEFAKERFGLNSLEFGVRFNHRDGGNSRAVYVNSRYFISIAPFNLYTHPLKGVREYSSFAHDRFIGSFRTDDWTLWLDYVCAHEMAHIVQFKMFRSPSKLIDINRSTANQLVFKELGAYEGGHGSFFQAIYRIMRDKFVNDRIPMVDRNVMVKQEFDRPSVEEKIVKDTRPNPLKGVQFTINERPFQVTGLNPNPKKRLYRYMAKELRTGKEYTVKLGDIMRTAVGKDELLTKHPSIAKELETFNVAQQSVRKARTTRRRRATRRANMDVLAGLI